MNYAVNGEKNGGRTETPRKNGDTHEFSHGFPMGMKNGDTHEFSHGFPMGVWAFNMRVSWIFSLDFPVDGWGRVVYQYKHPFRDGSTHVVLEPLPTYKLIQFHNDPKGCSNLRADEHHCSVLGAGVS